MNAVAAVIGPMTRETWHLDAVIDGDSDVSTSEFVWQDYAVCKETDPEAFFPEKGGSTKEAKRVCMGCPVQDSCLQYALDNEERFGVWGGLSERERRSIKRGRTPRPRRTHVAAAAADTEAGDRLLHPKERRLQILREAEANGIDNKALAELLGCTTATAGQARLRYRAQLEATGSLEVAS